MGKIETGGCDPIDVTRLVNSGLPKSWTCPHCHNRNRFDDCDEEILFEHFQLIRHCDHCCYLHYWKLELTDDFKKRVIDSLFDMLLKGET